MGAAFPEKPLRLRMGSCHSTYYGVYARLRLIKWLSAMVHLNEAEGKMTSPEA